jgi:hypothetical protein
MTREERQTLIEKASKAKQAILDTFMTYLGICDDEKDAVTNWCHANLKILCEFCVKHEKAKQEHVIETLKETTRFLCGSPLMMYALGAIAEDIGPED